MESALKISSSKFRNGLKSCSKSIQKPVQRSVQKPVQRSVQRSVQNPVEQPFQKPVQKYVLDCDCTANRDIFPQLQCLELHRLVEIDQPCSSFTTSYK